MNTTARVFFRNTRWLNEPLLVPKLQSETSSARALDVGAGGCRRAPNVTTMDILPLPGTDVIHNAESYPWPFPSNSFDYVILSNIFEHIADLIPFMKEVHRVLRAGGLVRGTAPHFSNPCTYADPTHKHAFSLHIFDWFIRRPAPAPFLLWTKKILGCDIGLGPQFGLNLFEPLRLSFYFREATWPTLVPIWGNLFQDFYEVYASRLIPAWDIVFELRAIKENTTHP